MIKGNLKTKIYQFYEDELPIEIFEQWVYDHTKEIENQLSEEDFITLIGHNFKNKFAKEEFFTAINHLINWNDYETLRIKNLLADIINKTDNFGHSLMETYDLYCKGYDFFADLVIDGSLNLVELHHYGLEDYGKLDAEIQKKIINQLHPKVLPSAVQVLDWINNDKIKLTGKKVGFYQRYEYYDYRQNNDSTEIEIVRRKEDIEIKQDKKNKSNLKQWWQFWKK